MITQSEHFSLSLFLFYSFFKVDERTMLCAGGQGKGGCQGDSGGQFVCNEGGKWVLRGVVSWGHNACRTDHYTVFARVSNFIGWINRKMQG